MRPFCTSYQRQSIFSQYNPSKHHDVFFSYSALEIARQKPLKISEFSNHIHVSLVPISYLLYMSIKVSYYHFSFLRMVHDSNPQSHSCDDGHLQLCCDLVSNYHFFLQQKYHVVTHPPSTTFSFKISASYLRRIGTYNY